MNPLSSFVTDDAMFARKRAELRVWEQAGYPDIDEPIAEAVKAFNLLPGVVTYGSCKGHLWDKDRQKAYICMVVNEEGLAHVGKIYQIIQVHVTDYIAKNWKGHDSFRYLELPLPRMVKLDISLHYCEVEKRYFTGVVLRSKLLTALQQNGWLKLLRAAVSLYQRSLLSAENERLKALAAEREANRKKR
jgi:hypothetical protein